MTAVSFLRAQSTTLSMTIPLERIIEPPRGLYFGTYSLVLSGDMSYTTYIRPNGLTARNSLTSMLTMQAEALIRFRQNQTVIPYVNLPSFIKGKTLSDLPSDAEVRRLFAEHEKSLLELSAALTALPRNEVRVTYAYSNIKLYTVNESYIDAIAAVSGFSKLTVRKIEKVLEHNHYSKAKVEYRYRTYLRNELVEPTVAQSLRNYLLSSSEIRPSRALLSELERPRRYTRSHYIRSHHYLEHNNQSELAFIHLITPGLIGRTITFEAKT